MTEPAPTVFVIDDDPSVRRALQRLMRSAGHRVEAFGSAREFLQRGHHNGPGCLVLDVRMPGLTGLDLQAALAAAGYTMPIIFITGHGDVPTSVRAMKAGAVDFLTKPFKDQELLNAVGNALARDRAARRDRTEVEAIHARLTKLTPREREVLCLVVTGMLNKEIAYDLGITERTVKVHRGRVMEKMRAGSLAELVRLAERVGITGPPHPAVEAVTWV